ncbi:hypothetical protein CCY99_05220 [Helicobacter sp. 16-1353]|uniref:energy transducer TonB n=1 Tax=Helicobacter sp. 16-1353 TaxID=2004996 RepID=UPI000DCD2209|nr:energy transducer TonB [Helicobacter sp. 16-1353]RAX54081.1 hypothetical protein CCY99_05220 [Helicobacter sp. 16-1353]
MAKTNNVDNLYFALSGIFAVFLYILLLFFIAFILNSNNHIKISINNPSKISSINVSLVDEVIEQIPQNIPKKPSPQNTNKGKAKTKESGSKTPIAGFGASDLFEKIDTKNLKPTKEDLPLADNRDKIALNKQKTDDNDAIKNEKLNEILQKTQNIMQTLQNLNENISISDSATSKFCDKYSDYCNKLAELLYSNWNIKSSFDTTLSSTVIIRISKDGIFSYTIKKKSGNDNFDNDLEESLEKLKNTTFPTLDDVDIDRLEVIFRNKKGD